MIQDLLRNIAPCRTAAKSNANKDQRCLYYHTAELIVTIEENIGSAHHMIEWNVHIYPFMWMEWQYAGAALVMSVNVMWLRPYY